MQMSFPNWAKLGNRRSMKRIGSANASSSIGRIAMLATIAACSGTPARSTASNGGTTGVTTGGSVNAGGAAASGGASTKGGGSSTAAAGSAALVNPAPGGNLFLGVNFWRIEWEGPSDYFQSGVDFTTTINPWNPSLLTDLTPFKIVRFMDWNATNDSSNPQASWDTRKPKAGDQTQAPVAFEWQIDLCNRAKVDYWVNVPHEANLTSYPNSLAQLIHSQLDASLRVYVEWSNEVWNGSFPQNAYAATQGTNLNLAGSNKALAYQVYASVRVWEAFEAVFGKNSPRLVKVLSGQHVWNGPCTSLMTAIADTGINPNATQPTVFAVAPYFSGTSISALQTSLAGIVSGLDSNATCASGNDLPLIAYEGGSDSYSAGSGCTTLQHDAGMLSLYSTFLDTLSAHQKGPFMQYTEAGSCWGLKEHTGDALASSPKYQAVTEWLASHP